MDPKAVNQNITVDDFDPLVTYANQDIWLTPDPSKNLPFNQSNSPWFAGTYHVTNVTNTSFTFDFDGPTLFVYGAAGPSYGSYEISIDGGSTVSTAYAAANATNYLLFGTSGLTYDNHTLKVTNLGAQGGDKGGDDLLFDYLQTTVQLAPAGATVANTTLEETDARLHYTGNWTINYSSMFSGGGSIFTSEANATFSVSFNGSALYIFGDKTDDHGLYSVVLDGRPAEQYEGQSACGGVFEHACEKDNTLKYFASNLDAGLHTVTLTNAGLNGSFFDLDSIVYTTPSEFAVRQPSAAGSSAAGASPTPGSGSSSGGASLSAAGSANLLLVAVCGAWWLGRFFRR
ncbi:hypothetical protein FIBSPDRAFT_830620 [Athelia psychrophila]|uniref:Uncharacterized protein n=1 Tax=Athelia psychrophila TaxID=1759441 RepID=A0A166G1Q4_9AGAM|nr:hypothetical protein FIBSPDRAFT_830620 [Fibularhizoctonia sp. CBS 109695]